MPEISVIMPVYNAEKYLAEAIESILNQTYTSFEFLIFNDGSTDNSANIINGYKDERIKLFSDEKNSGILIRLNQGIEVAKGKYIARMDADDISHPNRFETQINYFLQHQETALVYTNTMVIDSHGKRSNYSRVSPKNREDARAQLFFHCNIVHPSIMVKTEILQEFKYTPEFELSEDFYLFWQILRKYNVGYVDEIGLSYRSHEKNVCHTENVKQNAVVKKIYSIQLCDFLNKEVNPKEIELHFNTLRSIENLKNYKSAFEWLKLLRKTNRATNYFQKEYFEIYLSEYWKRLINYKIFLNQSILLIPYIFGSLSNTSNLSEKTIFLFRCFIRTPIIGWIPRYLLYLYRKIK